MSLQICSCCGWSKNTTYQGLRIHQGKKGCTPKGLRIPQSEQFSCLPKLTYVPPIKVEEPWTHIFSPSIKHEGDQNSWRNLWDDSRQMDSGPINSTLDKMESASVSPNLTAQTGPTDAAVIEMFKSLLETQQLSHQTATSLDKPRRALDFSAGAQQPFLMPVSQTLSIHASLATSGVVVNEANKSLFETPQRSHQTTATARRALDFSAGAQQPFLMPVSQTLSNQENPVASGVVVNEANKSLFETPQHSHQTTATARRALDFSAGAQQVGPLVWDPPTTTAQETAVQPKEKEREREREKEREAQKLLKARQDRISADLHQKINMREQKIAEVRSSVMACKGSLDTEWLEINNVFSKVTRVVEEARKKALQPLEERRQSLKREARDLVQKLQKEIDKLKKTIDVLDKTPNFQEDVYIAEIQLKDLHVLPLTGLDESIDWKNVTVDASFSFSTLRTTTSNMMEQIHQKLEKLSSVELKRIPTFAVDVKLDPTTAHRWLVLSPDGKKVRDGGKSQKVPDAPQRFDMFGSVMGLNSLTSGKSYWEVEVSNKTGWDLGVASRDANRKGKLSLNPDNGYWVTVHYEDEKYAALSVPPVSLSLTVKPQKVGVFVDYEEGLVSFYDVTAQSHIYSFTECSFTGEIFPYFSPHLKQNEINSDPLIISAVKKQ